MRRDGGSGGHPELGSCCLGGACGRGPFVMVLSLPLLKDAGDGPSQVIIFYKFVEKEFALVPLVEDSRTGLLL